MAEETGLLEGLYFADVVEGGRMQKCLWNVLYSHSPAHSRYNLLHSERLQGHHHAERRS